MMEIPIFRNVPAQKWR